MQEQEHEEEQEQKQVQEIAKVQLPGKLKLPLLLRIRAELSSHYRGNFTAPKTLQDQHSIP